MPTPRAKPNMTDLWAQTGTIIDPGSAKTKTGWVAEIPTFQNENFIQNRQDAFLAHLNDWGGVSEWDTNTTYDIESWARENTTGIVYRSKVTANQGNDPLTETTEWEILTLAGIGDPKIAIITDEKAFSVSGGSSIAGHNIRDLQTLNDPDSIILSLVANQIEIVAGKYLVGFISDCNNVSSNFNYFFNTTDTTTDILGVSGFATGTEMQTEGIGIIDISATKKYELRHFTQSVIATVGLGQPHSTSGFNNVYAQVTIQKIG